MTRQQEAFTTLMENYDKYQDLLETSQNSSGTAKTKYESYKESYQAAKESFTAAFESLVNNTPLNSMLTKLTEAGTWIIERLDKIIKYIPNTISQFTSILSLFGKSPLQIVGSRLEEYAAASAKRREDLGLEGSDQNIGSQLYRKWRARRQARKDKKAEKKAGEAGEAAEGEGGEPPSDEGVVGKEADGKAADQTPSSDMDAAKASSDGIKNNIAEAKKDSADIAKNLKEGKDATDKQSKKKKKDDKAEKKDAKKQAKQEEKKQDAATEASKKQAENAEAAADAAEKQADNAAKTTKESDAQAKNAEQITSEADAQTQNAKTQTAESDTQVKDEQNKTTQTGTQSQNAQSATTSSAQQKANEEQRTDETKEQLDNEKEKTQESPGDGTGSGSKSSGKISAILGVVQRGVNSVVAGITGALTGATTHKNQKGETVDSSEQAVNASRVASAFSGISSALPILGSVLSAGLTHAAEKIAAEYDKYRDMANSETEEANENLNRLSEVKSSLDSLADADLSSQEGQEAASDLLAELYSKDGEETRKLLNAQLSGSGDSVYGLLSVIKDDTASISEKTEALRKLQIAELESQKQQIGGKYASQMYGASETAKAAYAEASPNIGVWTDKSFMAGETAKTVGYGLAGAGVGAAAGLGLTAGIGAAIGAASASTMGVAATTAAAAGASAAVGGPVGIIIGAVLAIAAGAVAVYAGIQEIKADVEAEEKRRAEEAEFNAKSVSEKIVYVQDQMDQIIAYDSKTGENHSEILGEWESLLAALEEQNELINQMIDEIDDITLQQGLLSATYNGDYLADLSIAQLKNMGLDEILKAYAQGIEENGGLIGTEVWADDEHTQLTEAGFDYLRTKLKGQGDEEINAVISGSSYTLSELLSQDMKDKFKNAYWYQELLQSFADALNVPVSQIDSINEKFGELTLAEAQASASDTADAIASYADLLSSITEGAGNVSEWMSTIISQYPQLIEYMGDTSALMMEIVKKMENLQDKYLVDATQDIMDSEEYYKSTKSDFYALIGEDAQKELDAANITSGAELIEWLRGHTKTDENGNLVYDEVGQAIYDAYHRVMEENGASVVADKMKEVYDMFIEAETSKIDTEIDNLTEQKEALEEINSQREYENKLIEAKLKLENASKEKKRVYRAGVGWVYEEDQEAIKEAQEELDELDNERTISDLEAQIAELEQEKDDLSSIYEKQNAETLNSLYEAWLNANDPNSTNTPYYTIVEAIQGVQAKVSEQLDTIAKNSLTGKEGAVAKAKDAWDALVKASKSGSASEFNAALEAYQSAAKAAKEAGATDNDLKFEGTVQTNQRGMDDSVEIGTKGDLNKMKKSQKYNVVVPSEKDGKYYEGSVDQGTLQDDPTLLGYIFTDIKDKKKGYIITSDGEVISPWTSDRYKITDDDSSLREYANRLSNEAGLSDAIYVGAEGDNEAVWYTGGNFYKISSEEAANGFAEVEGSWNDDYLRWPGTADAVSEAAEGSYGLPGGATLVNELGTEAIITPMGTLTSLPSGTGVVPADITKNLWALGEVAPSIMRTLELTMAPDTIGKPSWSQSTDESFSIGNLTMNVTADDGFDVDEFVDSIKQRAALTRNL